MTTRMIDAQGREFWTNEVPEPDTVWLWSASGKAEEVPWSIARHYPDGTTVEEIVADLQAEQEVEA